MGLLKFMGFQSKDDTPKAVCWRPKNAFIECVVKTKCFEEKQTIEDCMAINECFLERKNWVLCKMNVQNPRYRLRGNPYDTATEDQKKIEARNERIMARDMEDEGVWSSQHESGKEGESIFQKSQSSQAAPPPVSAAAKHAK